MRLVRSGRKVNVKAAAKGLASGDLPTRKMSAIFWFSCAGCVVLLGLIAEQWIGRELTEWRARRAAVASAPAPAGEAHHAEASAHGEGHGEGAEGAAGAKKAPTDSFSLGLFTVELRSGPAGGPGGESADHGSRSMGEVEVVVQCASVEAKEFAEKNIPQVRNQVLDALSGFNRDEFLDRAGKRKLKLMMLDNLKRALPQAQVRDLYFPRLMVR